jgi:hypothetical protein
MLMGLGINDACICIILPVLLGDVGATNLHVYMPMIY